MTKRKATRADLEREIVELRARVKAQDEVITKLVAAPPAHAFYPCPLQHYPVQTQWPPRAPFTVPTDPTVTGPYDPPFYKWEITCDGGEAVRPISINAGVIPPLYPNTTGCDTHYSHVSSSLSVQ